MKRARAITAERLVSLTLLLVRTARPALAQSCDWWSGFDAGGMNSFVGSLMVCDDGAGPALFAAGSFDRAGGVVVNHIARWDGTEWSPLDNGMNDVVGGALAVFDDGTGPALYVAFNGVAANYIAKWDGTEWSPLAAEWVALRRKASA